MGEAAKKTAQEKEPKGDAPVTPFPDASVQANLGIKPDSIKAVEKKFREVIKFKEAKASADKALKDGKERLYETMKENNVPSYGLREGKTRWIADISEEPKLVVKKAKNDRD